MIETVSTIHAGEETREFVISIPESAETWIDGSMNAFVAGALPWLEARGYHLRVKGKVSKRLLDGIETRRWLLLREGVTAGEILRVEADQIDPDHGGQEQAALALTDDFHGTFSFWKLAAEMDPLLPRPTCVLFPCEKSLVFHQAALDRERLRGIVVSAGFRNEPVLAGDRISRVAALLFVQRQFGTGYVPCAHPYALADADRFAVEHVLVPQLSSEKMRVISHGAERGIAGKLSWIRSQEPAIGGVMPNAGKLSPLVEAGLRLIRNGEGILPGPHALLESDVSDPAVRFETLDFLRWLLNEPELLETPADRELEGRLRVALSIAADEVPDLPADRQVRFIHAPERPVPFGFNFLKRKSAPWEDGLALVSDSKRLTAEDLGSIVSWIRVRHPGFPAGAIRTMDLDSALKRRGVKPPRLVINMHEPKKGCLGMPGMLHGIPTPKSGQVRRMQEAGLPVPRSRVLSPGETLGDHELGPYVVVKPDFGARGAEVRISKAGKVKTDPIHVKFLNKECQPLIQEFIYSGPQPVSYRVGVFLGKAIYRWKVEARHSAGVELPEDGDFRRQSGNRIASSGRGCIFTDPSVEAVVALAERAALAFPEIPLMGVDIIKRLPDGVLFILELNPGGQCFHINTEAGFGIQDSSGLDFGRQYGAHRYLADLYKWKFDQFLARES